ncbi:RNA-binding protein [candidate division WWE3 bacterium]|nr:RNA-binding protein [candidate division WWE3 bacterium]
MAKKLFVGGLPYSMTERDLEALFQQAGQVDTVNIIIDREMGRSKGFGFVEMANDEHAAAAISRFNNYEIEGRTLVVNEARPMEDRGGNRGGGNRGGGNRNGGNRNGGGYNRGGGNRW